MRHITFKLLACITLFALSCISCKASDNSSQSAEPKIKTTKKATNNTSQATNTVANKNPQLQVIEVKSEKMGRSISNLVVLPESYTPWTKSLREQPMKIRCSTESRSSSIIQ